jgi:hypothetical protein
MAKIKYDAVDIRIFKESAEGRAYLEYNDKIGGEPFNRWLDIGDIDIDEQYGGIVGLYHECIKQGKTWQELLGTDGMWDEPPLA